MTSNSDIDQWLPEYQTALNLGYEHDLLTYLANIKKVYQLDYKIEFYRRDHGQEPDAEMIKVFFQDIDQGRLLNIGSACGEDQTYSLLQKGWSGVYCDPDPQAIMSLISKTKKFQDCVTIVNSAVTGTGGLRDLYLNPILALSTVHADWASPNDKKIITNSITLPQLVELVGEDFDYIQIDIEGEERSVIESIDWGTTFNNCKMIGIEGGSFFWNQLWAQGNYILTHVSGFNFYYSRVK